MDEKVIIALDFDSAEKVYAFLDRFGERKLFVKIGMELFYAEGPAIVREIKRRGHRIFLDLKLHDIPNTVGKAMRVLSGLDVDLCNLHASGTWSRGFPNCVAVRVSVRCVFLFAGYPIHRNVRHLPVPSFR